MAGLTNERTVVDFDDAFRSLTGFSPMGWQRRLFERFVRGEIPSVCDLPTGLGKTSVIPIWLLAVAREAAEENVRLPRRLAYIVNRRTVVDQATDTVEGMRLRLMDPDHPEWRDNAATLRTIAEALRRLCAMDGDPLAISTLRGELADNEEWKVDPARPAIIVGTIDMIGSKLLFSGYGDGLYNRAHHAGLIGQDTLFVHDEAHLTPAFSELLHRISDEQHREAKRTAEQGMVARPIRVIELSATSRGREGDLDRFALEDEDKQDRLVHDRLTANKRVYLHPAQEDAIVERIIELARAHEAGGAKVLIYVRSPEQAQQVARGLGKSLSRERIALLTGTIRGYERDQLVKTNPVYRAFLNYEQRVEESIYLVSTSAGEVGIDLDADHMVCDLTTLDSLIQRLGRVNRRGGLGRRSRVDIVGSRSSEEKPSTLDQAIAATFDLLRSWRSDSDDGVEASPGLLRERLSSVEPQVLAATFSPRPDAPALTDILLDAWSLTSIDTMPGRPDVASFLHGLTEDLPETTVIWRREVAILAKFRVDEAAVSEWFRTCNVLARERLRDQTDRVKKALANLLKSRSNRQEAFDFPLILLDQRGRARWAHLSEIVERDFNLPHRTVVLPVEACGLDRSGMLSGTLEDVTSILDVAEPSDSTDRRERWLHRCTAAGETYERLISGEISDTPPSGLHEKRRVTLMEQEETDPGGETVDLVLFVSPGQAALDSPETAGARQTLAAHTNAVVNQARSIADRLGLPDSVCGALVTAARWHDRGKARSVWQRYARNEDGADPVAKSPRYLHPRALGGYRHEFGSLLDATADDELQTHAERDLLLHLIAAHHGWARPHFEVRSYDNTYTSAENQRASIELVQRFDRLQQRFGRWGLAWLESLLRCADIVASQKAVAEAAAGLTEVGT